MNCGFTDTWLCICVYGRVCVPVPDEGQRRMSGILLYCPALSFLNHGLSPNLSLTELDEMGTTFQGFACLYVYPEVYVNSVELGSGPPSRPQALYYRRY